MRPSSTSPAAAWRIALSVPLFLFAFIATYLQFVRTREGQRWENEVLAAGGRGTGWLRDRNSGLLEVMDDRPLLIGAVVGVILVALVGRRWWAGLAAVVGMGLTVAASQVLKLSLLERPRLQTGPLPSHNSFPSGHVSLAMALVLALLVVLPSRLRVLAAVPGALWVASVSTATMEAGWHRLSDTLGAGLLAATVCCLAVGLLLALGKARRAVYRPGPLGLVLGWVAAVVAAGWFLVRYGDVDATATEIAMAAAQSASVLIVLAVTALLRSVELLAPVVVRGDSPAPPPVVEPPLPGPRPGSLPGPMPGPLPGQRRVASPEELRYYRQQLVP
ncbi:phosphatase PAP2 family protein [Crossiella cryophila]|uniref:Membrane-associated phospholipid phosphatase n=1 Tax=Crossiella cryophila TaxID=43355 RepID=A0A7W7CHX2_9PSEU|nr:phosphatase PAP2 family protein [Crossiella cryophila]MBB4681567.1 membrane-associated phospholipid phosphatase [Crossiella cryophila]